MVCGETGTGKTTFINCLLGKKVMNHRYEQVTTDTKTLSFTSTKSVALPNTSVLTKQEFNPLTASEEPGIALTETKVEIVDDDKQRLLLNIIDTPGFGENLNNEMCFDEIESYLKQQFDLVLAEETRIKRNPRFVDTRVHVLLYFITPTGHGLREIDIICMKRLSKFVNIIPVISKADSFTHKELATFKEQINIDIERFNVPIFQFDTYLSDYDEEEDYDLIQECKYLASISPFAVITSEQEFEIKSSDGQVKTVRAREYPWGLVDIANPKYSDFTALKNVLLGSHLQDLKDLTHDFLYETYRTERLTKVTGQDAEEIDEYEDSVEHHDNNKSEPQMPSMSNLAQIASGSSNEQKKSLLLDDIDKDSIVSPVVPESPSFMSSTSTADLEQSRSPSQSFKRLSIGPQRNQLRQISETVPYVIRHERILERQQKLEEMEMASAKELSNRAAALEAKAAELKSKEKLLLKRLEMEKARREASLPQHNDDSTSQDETEQQPDTTISKDETVTDLHSIVNS
jgi:septin 1 family protein